MNYELLDDLLVARGISRRKLALAAGIPPSTLQSAIEKEAQSFSIENMKKIAKVLDVPWWLFANYDVLTDEGIEVEPGLLATDSKTVEIYQNKERYSALEKSLLDGFHLLNNAGQAEAVKRVQELGEIPRYRKDNVR